MMRRLALLIMLPTAAMGQIDRGAPIIISGAAQAAPICPLPEDTVSLIQAIAAGTNAAILSLTRDAGCIWAWDGSTGHVLDQDNRSGLVQVKFSTFARMPAVWQRGIYWIERRYIQPASD